jgi:peptidoglycan/xylan/chitin deacetylase (PgdA/CDA1 family)
VSAISLPRWVAKKSARRGLALAMSVSGALALRRAFERVARVRVLTYHRFGAIARDPFCISRRDFEAQVRFLAEHRRAIGPEALRRFLAGEAELAPGSALITIDDGFASTSSEALPVLRDHGVPAIAFVTPSLIGNVEAGRAEPERYMTWDELGRLAEAGIETGAHGYSHDSLGAMSPAAAREQGARARERLESRLGRPVQTFAYPFGTRSDFNAATREALASVGYSLVFTSQHGSICAGMDAHELPRVKVENGDDLRQFARLCDGAMDAWRLVDTGLWRLQRPALAATQESVSLRTRG